MPPPHFSAHERSNYYDHGQNVQCVECKKTSTPTKETPFRQAKDTNTCQKCMQTLAKTEFRVRNKERSNTCKACERIVCASCKSTLPNEEYDDNTQQNYWQHRQTPVCKTCKALGCSNRDPKRYKCTGFCGEAYGHQKFEERQLMNWKAGSTKRLVCKECEKNKAKELKRLTKVLKSRDALKCTCKNNFVHDDKCALFPNKWLGQDLNVSKEQYEWWKAQQEN